MDPSAPRAALVRELAESVALTDLLGPDRGRYFGAGYRDVIYQVRGLAAVGGGSEFRGDVEITYPADWSHNDDGTRREPHLSTIDAAILPLVAIELGTAQSAPLERYRVRSLTLRAGSKSWVDLDSVPVTLINALPSDEGDWDLGATVGNIAVEYRSSADLPVASAPSLPRPDVSVYGCLFRQTSTMSRIASFEPPKRTLHALHETDTSADSACASGFEGAIWPCLSAVDVLVVMGQLAQAAIFLSSSLDRMRMGTLWMRSVTYVADDPPPPLPHSWRSSTTLARDRLVGERMPGVHDVVVACRSSIGARVNARLAYSERIRS